LGKDSGIVPKHLGKRKKEEVFHKNLTIRGRKFIDDRRKKVWRKETRVWGRTRRGHKRIGKG